MEELLQYVTENYNGLMEIYTTQIDQSKMTFDDFCMTMYHAHLKKNK